MGHDGPDHPDVPPGLGLKVAALTHNQIHSPPGKEVSAIKKAEQPRVKRMNLNVPVELHNNFKAVTASRGLNMTDVLMEFIEQYVAKHGNPPSSRRDGASETCRPIYEGQFRRSAPGDAGSRPASDGRSARL